MRVNVVPVHMGADDDLIASEMLLCKCLCDLQSQLRRDFPRLEGLDDVVALHPVLLMVLGFRLLHPSGGKLCGAVQSGGEHLLIGLVSVEGVLDKRLHRGMPG